LPAIVFCGIFWFGIYNVALNEAERRVDAGTAAMLVNIGPILIAVLAGIMLREGFPPKLLAGCLVAFWGRSSSGSRHQAPGSGRAGASFSVWSPRSPTQPPSSRKSRCSQGCRACR
jgi:hypothetical protein